MEILREISLQGSVLLLCMLLARRILRARVDARLIHALWALPLARLLLPIRYSLPWPVQKPVFQAALRVANVAAFSKMPNGAVESVLPGSAAVQKMADWSEILSFVWLAGVVLLSLYLLGKNVRFFRRLYRESSPVTLPPCCEELLSGSGVREVRMAKSLHSPCLAGVFRPRLYVNDRTMADEKRLEMALRHELAHARRKDNLWLLLGVVALAVHWFNPLVWIAFCLSRRDCELACDWSATKDMDLPARQEYGMALICLAACEKAAGSLLHATTALSGNKKLLEERIRMLKNHKKTEVCIATCVLVLALLIGGVICASARESSAIGIIGGADGPTAIFVTDGDTSANAVIGGADGPTSIYVSGEPGGMVGVIAFLMEAHAPDAVFENIPPEELDALTGDLADSFAFIGRRSQDGAYAYILGNLTARSNPLDGLSVGIRAEGNRETLEFTRVSENRETGEVLYKIPGVSYCDFGKNLLFCDLSEAERSMAPAAALVVAGEEEGMRILTEALSREVTVLSPLQAPFAVMIYMQEGYPVAAEYFPLTGEQAVDFMVQEKVEPELGNGCILRYVTGESDEWTEELMQNRPIPVKLLEMARQKCGIRTAE